jgi:ubiquinone biosynthesis accessory factor UbiK
VEPRFIDEISRRAAELIAKTPIQDVQKNLRALFSSWLERLDLVTREEFDAQREVLRRTREKLERMEARVAELEKPRTMDEK